MSFALKNSPKTFVMLKSKMMFFDKVGTYSYKEWTKMFLLVLRGTLIFIVTILVGTSCTTIILNHGREDSSSIYTHMCFSYYTTNT